MTEDRADPIAAAGPALIAEALRRFGAVRLRAVGGSMLPAIVPGDLLVVVARRADDLRPRDVVLFQRDGRLFVHRLLTAGRQGGRRILVTRGDANWHGDPPIDDSHVLGLVVAVQYGDHAYQPPAACTAFGRVRGLAGSAWIGRAGRFARL